MSRIQSTKTREELFFVTFTIVHWIDVFTRLECKEIIIERLKYCQKEKGLLLFSYVIMSNHIHLIIGSDGKCAVSDIIRDFKKYTSKKIYEFINHANESRKSWMLPIFRKCGKNNPNNTSIQVWIQDNNPMILETPDFFWQKVEYIHDNPLKTGIVFKPEDYVFSSASSYAGLRGDAMIDVIVVE
jgi:putative transposase